MHGKRLNAFTAEDTEDATGRTINQEARAKSLVYCVSGLVCMDVTGFLLVDVSEIAFRSEAQIRGSPVLASSLHIQEFIDVVST
jgi:hypothetical protein